MKATIVEMKRCGCLGLDRIKVEVNSNDNIDVTLLIVTHCVKALKPCQFFATKNGYPYAFKTLLGW